MNAIEEVNSLTRLALIKRIAEKGKAKKAKKQVNLTEKYGEIDLPVAPIEQGDLLEVDTNDLAEENFKAEMFG
jgi:hypothetical protein